MSMLRRFVFLGAPGVGKGTFADIIAPKLGIPLIGVGDLIRATIGTDSALGREFRRHVQQGHLVPDEFIMELVEERLKQSDAQGGWLLDGYPRTVSQAAHLDTVARPHKVINITLEHRIAVQKMQARRHCRLCKRSFNVCSIHEGNYDMPAMLPDFDACSHGQRCPREIHGREDDTDAIVVARMKVHEQETAPLIQHYQKTDRLVTFSVVRGVKDADALMAHMLE